VIVGRVGVWSEMLENQVMEDRRNVVVTVLYRKLGLRYKYAIEAGHDIRFLSAFLNLLLASSVLIRLLESSSSCFEPAFRSLVDRVGSVASSPLESPSCHGITK